MVDQTFESSTLKIEIPIYPISKITTYMYLKCYVQYHRLVHYSYFVP